MNINPFGCAALLLWTAACGAGTAAPATDELINRANTLDLAGKQDDAIALYEQALLREPRSYKAHYGIGRALDLAGHYDEARAHFSTAIALATPGDRNQATRMLGIAWTFVGNAEQAAAQFRDVFERQVADRNFGGAADVANELGRVYLELGDADHAADWYRTGHETAMREADLPAWRVDLVDLRWAHAQARIAARRGQAVEARKQEAVVSALLDKGGNDDQRIQFAYLRGYVEFFLGHDEAALAELAKADPSDPFILLLMGDAHAHLGHADEARASYEQVLRSTSHAVNNAFARPAARRHLQ